MKIEVAICPFIVRFQKTCRLYALRIACMTENHPIRQQTPITFPLEYQTGIDLDKNKFLDWNETSIQTTKKHSTQLIRVLHTLFDLLPNTPKLEEYSSETSLKECNLEEFSLKQKSFSKENSSSQNSQNPWNFKISKENKDQTTKNYLNLIKRIISKNQNAQHTLIYMDGSKILANVGAGIAYMCGRNSDEKS